MGAYPETHPQASDSLADLKHFKAKIDAGADAAITQYFFNPDAYFHFVDEVRRLGVPITPGIMPIANQPAAPLLRTVWCGDSALDQSQDAGLWR